MSAKEKQRMLKYFELGFHLIIDENSEKKSQCFICGRVCRWADLTKMRLHFATHSDAEKVQLRGKFLAIDRSKSLTAAMMGWENGFEGNPNETAVIKVTEKSGKTVPKREMAALNKVRNEKLQTLAYEIAHLVVKSGQERSVGEKVIKPVLMLFCKAFDLKWGDSDAQDLVRALPLGRNNIVKKTLEMTEDIRDQMGSFQRKNPPESVLEAEKFLRKTSLTPRIAELLKRHQHHPSHNRRKGPRKPQKSRKTEAKEEAAVFEPEVLLPSPDFNQAAYLDYVNL